MKRKGIILKLVSLHSCRYCMCLATLSCINKPLSYYSTKGGATTEMGNKQEASVHQFIQHILIIGHSLLILR